MHFFVQHNFQFALLIVQSAKVKNNIFVASKSGLFSPFVYLPLMRTQGSMNKKKKQGR